MTRPCALVGTVALVALLATPAHAVPILEQTLIATGGDVVVTFVSNDAGFMSELYLDGQSGDQSGAIFNNFTTPTGTIVNLGSFTAGTELIFTLLVKQTGDLFFTGDASRNEDGVVHARLQDAGDHVLVGFEDLFGGGDLDFNDLVFSFTDVVTAGTSGSDGIGEPTGSVSGPVAGQGSGVGAGSGTGAGTVANPATVDEPGALVMLGSGLAMLAVAMRRRAA